MRGHVSHAGVVFVGMMVQELPEELSACRKLERLAVNSNKLSYLPQVGSAR